MREKDKSSEVEQAWITHVDARLTRILNAELDFIRLVAHLIWNNTCPGIFAWVVKSTTSAVEVINSGA